MLGIGYFSARVAGNLLANMENTRYLGYLHMELDPEKFLACYADIPGRLKPGSQTEAIYRSNLADGYAAAGKYEQALELLEKPIPAGNLALKGLYAANRCGCLLEAGIVIGIPGDAGQGIGRLGKQGRSAVAVISAQQGLGGLLQALGELLGILQQLPALLQNLVLPAFQVRLFNFRNLVFQSFHAAQLLAL